jgi:hypothetical protein
MDLLGIYGVLDLDIDNDVTLNEANNMVRFLNESDENDQFLKSIMRDAVFSSHQDLVHWERVIIHLQTAITSREKYIVELEGIRLEGMGSYERERVERWRNSEVSRLKQAIRSMSGFEVRWQSEYERLQNEVTFWILTIYAFIIIFHVFNVHLVSNTIDSYPLPNSNSRVLIGCSSGRRGLLYH